MMHSHTQPFVHPVNHDVESNLPWITCGPWRVYTFSSSSV